MKKYSKFIQVALIASLLASAPITSNLAFGDTNSSLDYLASKTQNPWITMALIAGGRDATIEYLKTADGEDASSIETPIMAIAAAGEDPKTFPEKDLIQKLKGFYKDGQIGDVSLLNDDIFGIIALEAAGEPSSDPVISGASNFIINNQNPDGGWAFAVGGTSDTNMTAMAITALLESGSSSNDAKIKKAVEYLKNSQNEDGGFPYDPKSPWGTASDASSDAWVISAIYKLGEDPEGNEWTKGGNNPINHLKSLETLSGFFEYQEGSGEDSFSPITTSYAVIALSGKAYPVLKNSETNNYPLVNYKIETEERTLCEGDDNAPNPLELIKIIAAECGFSYNIKDTSFGPYLDKVGEYEASGTTGWMYAVNFLLPNIGAADYALSGGDYVLWHFGGFSWTPGGSSIDLSANILPKSEGDNGENDNGSIGFNIEIPGGGSSLSFGDILPGESKSKLITLTNSGNVKISVKSSISGDDVFRNYLNIGDVSWRNFGLALSLNDRQEVNVKLEIPSSYSGSGSKNGKLVFWATPNNE